MGAYGNPWITTPNLDALADESLRFTRAYPESIPTIPARRAIHTGLRTWPFRNWDPPKGEDINVPGWQPIPIGQTHLAEILKHSGYYTMLVTDNMQQYKASYNFQRGFDAFYFIRGQTRDHYRPLWTTQVDKVGQTLTKGDEPFIKGMMLQYFANTADRHKEDDWFAPRVFTIASEFLEAANEGHQPFFLTVDCYDPHEPWDPPQEYVSLYDDPYDGPEPYVPAYGTSDYLTGRELERMRALYAGEVTMMDRWLGRFLDKMDELKLFDSTLLVVLSDHGVCLGEHGYTGKPSQVLFPELTDIPFLLRHPEGRGGGKTSEYYASTHDVAPTILGFLGLQSREPMQGEDLSVILAGNEPEPRPHFTIGYADRVWARDDRYMMFSRDDGKHAALYNVHKDPEMRNDVAGKRPNVTQRMFNDYVLKDAGGPLPDYYGTE